MIKIDLHTHSVASKDGGIRPDQYAELLEQKVLDVIAITDHDETRVARELHASFGERIIIGEEITTSQGDLIGLYLKNTIKPGMSARQTAEEIHAQGGLVYVPHPFETVRAGITEDVLGGIADLVDIIEAVNGRAVLHNKGPKAMTWAAIHHKVIAAGSDAHSRHGTGATFTTVKNIPLHETLLAELSAAELTTKHPPYYTLLAPKVNRFRNRFGHS